MFAIYLMLLLIPLCYSAPPKKVTHTSPTIQRLEDTFKNKLHQSWVVPDRPSEYPRKGEYPCKSGICRVPVKKTIPCEDCQEAIPIEFS